jgi:hypothetical protein
MEDGQWASGRLRWRGIRRRDGSDRRAYAKSAGKLAQRMRNRPTSAQRSVTKEVYGTTRSIVIPSESHDAGLPSLLLFPLLDRDSRCFPPGLSFCVFLSPSSLLGFRFAAFSPLDLFIFFWSLLSFFDRHGRGRRLGRRDSFRRRRRRRRSFSRGWKNDPRRRQTISNRASRRRGFHRVLRKHKPTTESDRQNEEGRADPCEENARVRCHSQSP